MTAQDRAQMSVMLTAKDMQVSMPFYRDQLGFELKESWPDADAPHWCNMTLQGQSVMMGSAMDPATVGQYCEGDAEATAYWTKAASAFQENKAGVGVQIYLMVPDVDAYTKEIVARGVEVVGEPKTQFYGIREIGLHDPDSYRLVFFTPVSMQSCQSCGMPLTEAEPGQMYCGHCIDESGHLKPYETILEGTVSGYFMGMQQMERADAEVAAKEHLSKMPAWNHA